MDKVYRLILNFFGTILKLCNDITGHYLIALLVFALLLKIILLPFGIKQQKNAQKQAKLKPKELAIRKKYRGRTDQATTQKMNMEIQEMYQKEGYNAFGGCLPLLIQMPILWIIYRVMMNPLQYICKLSSDSIAAIQTLFGVEKLTRGDVELLQYINGETIASVQAKIGETFSLDTLPNLDLFGIDNALAVNPSFKTWLIVIPIITFVGQFFTMRLTRKFSPQPMQDDAAQNKTLKIMDFMMPALTTWISFSVPAAIGLYWFFNNILSLAQSFILSRVMPLPVITEEEIREAEKEYSAKTAKKKLAEASAKKSKYEDDEDDTPVSSYTDSGEGPTRFDRE